VGACRDGAPMTTWPGGPREGPVWPYAPGAVGIFHEEGGSLRSGLSLHHRHGSVTSILLCLKSHYGACRNSWPTTCCSVRRVKEAPSGRDRWVPYSSPPITK